MLRRVGADGEVGPLDDLARTEGVGVEEEGREDAADAADAAAGRRAAAGEQAAEERLLLDRRHEDRRRAIIEGHRARAAAEGHEGPHERAVRPDPVDDVLVRVGRVDRRDEHRRLAVEVALGVERDVVPVHQAARRPQRVGRGAARLELVDHRVQVEEDRRLARRRVEAVDHARPVDGPLRGVVARPARDGVHVLAEVAAGPGLDADDVAAEGRVAGEERDRRVGGRREIRGDVRDRDIAEVLRRRLCREGGEGRRRDARGDDRRQELAVLQLLHTLELDVALLPRRLAPRLGSGRSRHSVISLAGLVHPGPRPGNPPARSRCGPSVAPSVAKGRPPGGAGSPGATEPARTARLGTQNRTDRAPEINKAAGIGLTGSGTVVRGDLAAPPRPQRAAGRGPTKKPSPNGERTLTCARAETALTA